VRIRAILRFILSVLKTKMGAGGFLLALLKPLWNAFAAWQGVDFLSGRMTPIFDFLNGVWGPYALMVIGFSLMAKAVYDRLPETQDRGTPTSHSAAADSSQLATRQPITDLCIDI